ncbi:GNAT family N-acetyltransferase [Isoptericola sp. NPDC057653]|uniref:GNAT family N-acetyltransferase n=1 Tax=Isoptericola sp. NPDC057653 TaxID=3346195 RepID=UPI0036801AAE
MPLPTVRPARPDDAAAVWPLARDLATSFRPRREVFESSFATLTAREDSLVAVVTYAAVGPGPLGYLLAGAHLTFFADGPVCWVEEVMVDPAHRGRGLGRALLDHAERWAAARGAAYVSLATRRAGAFYEALGYDASATFYRRDLASGT